MPTPHRVKTGAIAAAAALGMVMSLASPAAAADPFGSYDGLSSPGPGQVRVTGWAVDPDDTTGAVTIGVHGLSDGTYGITASSPRPDVAAAYPEYGPNHGFDVTFNTNRYGNIPIELKMGNLNTPGGEPVSMGTKTVYVAPASPVGEIESVTSPRPGVIKIRGWAFDPNSQQAAVNVKLTFTKYAGTTSIVQTRTILANRVRRDIAREHNTGIHHGFEARFATTLNGDIFVDATASNVKGTPGMDYRIDWASFFMKRHKGSPSGWASTTAKGHKIVASGAAFDPNGYKRPVRMRTLITKGTARETHDYWAARVSHPIGRYLPGAADRHAFHRAWSTRFRGKIRVRTYAFNRTGKGGRTLLRDRTLHIR